MVDSQIEEIYAYNGHRRLTQGLPSDHWKMSKALFIELIKDKKKFIQNYIGASPSSSSKKLKGLFSNLEIIMLVRFGNSQEGKAKAIQYLENIFLANSTLRISMT